MLSSLPRNPEDSTTEPTNAAPDLTDIPYVRRRSLCNQPRYSTGSAQQDASIQLRRIAAIVTLCSPNRLALPHDPTSQISPSSSPITASPALTTPHSYRPRLSAGAGHRSHTIPMQLHARWIAQDIKVETLWCRRTIAKMPPKTMRAVVMKGVHKVRIPYLSMPALSIIHDDVDAPTYIPRRNSRSRY